MSLIIYELNEVPKRLFDFYGDAFPDSSFAYLRKYGYLFETITADLGNLSPWITWPTMHRGVSNIQHEISDLGQDLTAVNKEFPSIHKILVDQGIKVGVFGCLQSYPLPINLTNYSFYVPDTFSMGDECHPEYLSYFQAFNLSMVKANGRNVSKGIALRDAARFLLMAKKLGITLDTFLKLAEQICNEHINKNYLVRRRTSQAQIAFDLFLKQQIKTNPDVSFFFTNHLASNMHRYWPTIFPEDYQEGKFELDWLKKWRNEIPHAVKVANEQLKKLINYCNATKSELILCSSMGQAAVENVIPIEKQIFITNVKKLLRYLGIHDNEWEPRLSMAPLVIVKPLNDNFYKKIINLRNIRINDKPIDYVIIGTGEIRFTVNLYNQEAIKVSHGNLLLDNQEIGIENINLQDASGSYAYHIAEGILLRYSPLELKNDTKNYWEKISVLDFAPSLINKFDGNKPSYMKGEFSIFKK